MAETSKSTQNSKKIGDYLLRGWTMLSDHCPNPKNDRYCTVPLVGNKTVGTILCVNCGTLFKRTEEGEVIPIEGPLDSNKKEPNIKPEIKLSTEPKKKAFQMTTVVEEEEEDDDEKEKSEEDEHPHGIESGQLNDENDDFAAEHEFKPQDYSEKMKEKIAKGWIKISEQCPKCFVPLIRDPDSDTMFCVSCETQIIAQKDFDPKRHRIVGKVGTFEQNLAEEVETDEHKQEVPEEPGPRPLIYIPDSPPQQQRPHPQNPPNFPPQNFPPQNPPHPPQNPQNPPHPQNPQNPQNPPHLHHPPHPQNNIQNQDIQNFFFQRSFEMKQRLVTALNNQLSQAEVLLNRTPFSGNQALIRETVATVSEINQLLQDLKK